VSVYRFVAAEKASHSIAIMCRVLEVSRSGYHAWVRRPPSPRALEDARLTARIRVLHKQRREVYGSPRIWSDLVLDDGERIGRKRVERLMRQAGLSGLITKKWRATTIRVPGVRVADDLLDRNFAAGAPNRCWVADITYLRTWEGWLYLVAVQDLYSRRIVGWAMADHLRAELVTDALQMALTHRRPARGLIWHSDQGSQGGFNRSSQHLVMEVVRDGCWEASAGDSCDARADVVAGPAVGGAAGGSAAVLADDRGGTLDRRRGRGGGRVGGGWRPMVS
jgi:putative transposase